MAAQLSDMQERGCFLDGYSLLEMMVLCRAGRGLPFLVQEIFTVSKAFTEANSVLQAMLCKLSLHVPGFREGDIPLIGCVLPLRHAQDYIHGACNPGL